MESIVSIAQASIEQAEAVTNVTLGLDQISSVVQTNAATAEESAASSEELSGQASILESLMAQFKLMENDSKFDMIDTAGVETAVQPSQFVSYGGKY